jgi:hypothetical protein
MTWFTEDSTPFLVLGVIVEALLVLAVVKTGRVWILYAMVGVALVVGAIVWIEKHTITDTKRVRATLESAAAALEQNNLPGLLDCIAPTSLPLRDEAARVLRMAEFKSVYVSHLVVHVNRFNNPPSATADFTVHANGNDRTGMVPYSNFFRVLHVTFRWEKDRWLIESYNDTTGDQLPRL